MAQTRQLDSLGSWAPKKNKNKKKNILAKSKGTSALTSWTRRGTPAVLAQRPGCPGGCDESPGGAGEEASCRSAKSRIRAEHPSMLNLSKLEGGTPGKKLLSQGFLLYSLGMEGVSRYPPNSPEALQNLETRAHSPLS